MKSSKILISISINNEIQLRSFVNYGLPSLNYSFTSSNKEKKYCSINLFIFVPDKSFKTQIKKVLKNKKIKFSIKIVGNKFFAFTKESIKKYNKLTYTKSNIEFKKNKYDLLIDFLPEYYVSKNFIKNLISMKDKGIKKFYALTPKIAEGDILNKLLTKNNYHYLNSIFVSLINKKKYIYNKDEFVFNFKNTSIIRSKNPNLICITNINNSNKSYFINTIEQGLVFKILKFYIDDKKFYLSEYTNLSYLFNYLTNISSTKIEKFLENYCIFYKNKKEGMKKLKINNNYLKNINHSKFRINKLKFLENDFNVSIFNLFYELVNSFKKKYNPVSLNLAILMFYLISNLPWKTRVFLLRLILKKSNNFKSNLVNFGSFFYNLNRKTLAFIMLKYIKLY